MTQDYSHGQYWPDEGISYPLLRHIVSELQPAGTALEFGVSNGSSLKIIAAHMPAVGFDSFAGLPEAWRDYPEGMFASEPPDVPNTQLVTGLFADTLPGFDFKAVEPIGLVHMDCDLYSSTTTVLEHLRPHIQPGCYIVLDNYWKFHPDGRQETDQVQQAWREFSDRTQPKWNVVGYSDETWAIQITIAPEAH
jgi:predicted O-methyltransferase YrrM